MITASALKAHCGYARVLNDARPRTESQQTAIDAGVRFHAAVESWVRSGALPAVDDAEVIGWLDLLAAQWRPRDTARVEVAWGLTPDGHHSMVSEPEPHVYRSLDGKELLTAGRADLCWILPPVPRWEGNVLAVVDYKTGRWPVPHPDENLQVNAAGMALADRFGASAYVPGIYYARDGHFEWGNIVKVGSVTHLERLAAVQEAALLDETPRPGEWCEACWSKKACGAYKAKERP